MEIISSTNKTDCQDTTEILLKEALSNITLTHEIMKDIQIKHTKRVLRLIKCYIKKLKTADQKLIGKLSCALDYDRDGFPFRSTAVHHMF